MQITIYPRRAITLNDQEIREVVDAYLAAVIADRWVDGGKVWTERYTSHKFDHELGNADDPQFGLLVAALNFRKALRENRKEK